MSGRTPPSATPVSDTATAATASVPSGSRYPSKNLTALSSVNVNKNVPLLEPNKIKNYDSAFKEKSHQKDTPNNHSLKQENNQALKFSINSILYPTDKEKSLNRIQQCDQKEKDAFEMVYPPEVMMQNL